MNMGENGCEQECICFRSAENHKSMHARRMNSSLMKESESLLGFLTTYQMHQIHRSYFACRTKQTNKKKRHFY